MKTTITEIKPIHKDIASSLEIYRTGAKAAREEIKEMRVSDTEPWVPLEVAQEADDKTYTKLDAYRSTLSSPDQEVDDLSEAFEVM